MDNKQQAENFLQLSKDTWDQSEKLARYRLGVANTHALLALEEAFTQEKALTEIQRVVTRAVARGDNSSYIDQISGIITDQMTGDL